MFGLNYNLFFLPIISNMHYNVEDKGGIRFRCLATEA